MVQLHKFRHKRSGFTLTETLIAVTIGLVIIAVVIGLLTFVQRLFFRETERMAPREVANLAINTLHQYVQDAWYYQIGNDGSSITFDGPAGHGVCTFNAQKQSLSFQAPGTPAPKDIIPEKSGLKVFKIDELTEAKGPNGEGGQIHPGILRLSLEIERPQAHGKLQSLGDFKATGEILIQAIAFRDDSLHLTRVQETPQALMPVQ